MNVSPAQSVHISRPDQDFRLPIPPMILVAPPAPKRTCAAPSCGCGHGAWLSRHRWEDARPLVLGLRFQRQGAGPYQFRAGRESFSFCLRKFPAPIAVSILASARFVQDNFPALIAGRVATEIVSAAFGAGEVVAAGCGAVCFTLPVTVIFPSDFAHNYLAAILLCSAMQASSGRKSPQPWHWQ